MHSDTVDCVVVGAGVIGLAVGRALALRGLEVIVVEAASATGTGTSSRNSEVVHAGIYYPPGTLKAQLCVAGRQQLYRYCAGKGIPHARTGKLIVATRDAEIPVLDSYLEQARANGVSDLARLGPADVADLEPAVHCVQALHSPSTGIIDSRAYMLALQGDLEAHRGIVALNTRVDRVVRRKQRFEIQAGGATVIRCAMLVNAAGLHAQELAGTIEALPPATIPSLHLARGHYYRLAGKAPFRHLVYPLAGPADLGIHVTLDLGGAVRFGPDLQWIASVDYSFDPHRREDFVTAIRRYYPGLDAARLQPGHTGIRPKLSGPGEPAADFMVQGEGAHGVPGLVNLYGIDSPGLTASLAMADHVAGLLDRG
ncbi:MAG: NAD(P)/FAD-dependent oxidoreductase [Gammaproteobacteria bacterium]|nr:NAD(P)/FAD-dependent oxidoreductase [Gammaproteobacteria bacterium]